MWYAERAVAVSVIAAGSGLLLARLLLLALYRHFCLGNLTLLHGGCAVLSAE